MTIPLRITFRHLTPTEAIESYIRAKAEKLDDARERITSCHVAVEAPHRSQVHGNPYRVRVDLSVPGAELVADRAPDASHAIQDLYAAIDAAFDGAVRRLREHAARIRDTRRHDGDGANGVKQA